jgi:hypothetical protein
VLVEGAGLVTSCLPLFLSPLSPLSLSPTQPPTPQTPSTVVVRIPAAANIRPDDSTHLPSFLPLLKSNAVSGPVSEGVSPKPETLNPEPETKNPDP